MSDDDDTLVGADLRAAILRDMAKLRRERPEFFAKALRGCERSVRRKHGRKAAEEHVARVLADLDAAEAQLTPPADAGTTREGEQR